MLYDAHYGNNDPTRRQVNERLQQLGGRLEPHIEVEYLAGALRLAAMGVGDTIVARAAVDGGLLPNGLLTTPFAEPLYDTLAVAKQRHLPLSPATRELRSIALERLAAFDRAQRAIGQGCGRELGSGPWTFRRRSRAAPCCFAAPSATDRCAWSSVRWCASSATRTTWPSTATSRSPGPRRPRVTTPRWSRRASPCSTRATTRR